MKIAKSFFILTVIVCVLFWGCLSGCEKKDSSENILQVFQEHLESVKSIKGDYDLLMALKVETEETEEAEEAEEGEKADNALKTEKMTISGSFDFEMMLDPMAVHRQGNISALAYDVEMDNYIVQSEAGSGELVSYTASSDKWTKTTAHEDGVVPGIFLNADIFAEERWGYNQAETPKILITQETYLVTSMFSSVEIIRMLDNALNEIMGTMAAEWEFPDDPVPVKIYVDKGSLLPKAVSLEISDEHWATGTDATGVKMSLGGIILTIDVEDYDSTAGIEVPNEALQGRENAEKTGLIFGPLEETEPDWEADAADFMELQTGKWVNFDCMQFLFRGKTYNLGQSTLQKLIDDGIPFEKDDLANAQNNVSANSESQEYNIILGENCAAQIYTMNVTEENKSAAECYISRICLSIDGDQDGNALCFAFPLNITEKELLEQAGEPTAMSETEDADGVKHTLEYKRHSTMYFNDWGYDFEFINGEMKNLTLTWLP